MPDVNLFEPLSQTLGITLTELLHGEIMEEPLSKEVSDSLIKDSLKWAEVNKKGTQSKQKRIKLFFITLCCSLFSLFLLFQQSDVEMTSILIITSMLCFFQIYFTFFVKEILPKYYDENKISYYTDGFVRIHIAGVYFNNHNWIPIIQAICFGMTCCSLLNLVILGITIYFKIGELIRSILILVVFLRCLLIPFFINAKKN